MERDTNVESDYRKKMMTKLEELSDCQIPLASEKSNIFYDQELCLIQFLQFRGQITFTTMRNVS